MSGKSLSRIAQLKAERNAAMKRVETLEQDLMQCRTLYETLLDHAKASVLDSQRQQVDNMRMLLDMHAELLASPDKAHQFQSEFALLRKQLESLETTLARTGQ